MKSLEHQDKDCSPTYTKLCAIHLSVRLTQKYHKNTGQVDKCSRLSLSVLSRTPSKKRKKRNVFVPLPPIQFDLRYRWVEIY